MIFNLLRKYEIIKKILEVDVYTFFYNLTFIMAEQSNQINEAPSGYLVAKIYIGKGSSCLRSFVKSNIP